MILKTSPEQKNNYFFLSQNDYTILHNNGNCYRNVTHILKRFTYLFHEVIKPYLTSPFTILILYLE